MLTIYCLQKIRIFFFTGHSIIIFQFNAFIKAPPKTLRFVYDYAKNDFEGLRTALAAINLSSIIANDDINTDCYQWKDTFLVAVSDYIQIKRLKGRNPIPWMSGAILNLIKKKECIRQKLKLSPSSHLREKFKKKTWGKQLSACCGTAVMSWFRRVRPQHKPKAILVGIEAEFQIAYTSWSSLNANISQCIQWPR